MERHQKTAGKGDRAISNKDDLKLALQYPCRWVYKVIGLDEKETRKAIAEVIGEQPYTVSLSHTSTAGTYQCLNMEIHVYDEENRIALYVALKSHPAIKMVL